MISILELISFLFSISPYVVFISSLYQIEEQHKKALEEDPSVFDYDGVYDEMKEKAVRPLVPDRQERKVL